MEIELTWKHLYLHDKENKEIIHDFSGQIKSGEMIGIIGSSGAGKTTLLNLLAGRTDSDLISNGKILLNGWDRESSTWTKISSFVSQEFHTFKHQTVKETFEFVFKLKTGKVDKIKMDELLNLLGLKRVEDSYVNVLSGGEYTRLGIGLELVGEPSLLFLDEPTSGLDSFNAIKILEFLKYLTTKGTAVLLTIHQPSSQMVKYFHSLIIMSVGGTVFNGTIKDCIEFYKENGFILPEHTNPVDFFVEKLSVDATTEATTTQSEMELKKLMDSWIRLKPEYQMTKTERVKPEEKPFYTANILILYWRYLNEKFRNKPMNLAKIFQKLLFAFLLSTTFWRFADKEVISILSFRGLMTFFLINTFFGLTGPLLNSFVLEKQIIFRERRSGFYTGYIVFFAKFLTELTYNWCYDFPYFTLIYYLTGIYGGFLKYLQFLTIMFVIEIFAITFSLSISGASPDPLTSQIIGVTLTISFVLYSGAFSDPKELPNWLVWLIWISPIQYGFRALVQTQSKDELFEVDGTGTGKSLNGDELTEYFGLKGLNFTICVGIIFSCSILMFIIGSRILHRLSRNQLFIEK